MAKLLRVGVDAAVLPATPTARCTAWRSAAPVGIDEHVVDPPRPGQREWAALSVPPSLQLRLMGLTAAGNSALAPIGLMTAVVAHDHPAALLLPAPLLAVIAALAF
jgi:hypothetical protein